MNRYTTFQDEMYKIFGDDEILYNTKYVGRAVYGSLDSDLKLKAEFITSGISSHYDTLRIAIINRKDGEIDRNLIKLNELWGNKQVNNPNFREGVSPHLWLDGDKLCWYVYQPTPIDMERLKDTVDEYVDVFREQTMEEDMGMQMQ